MPSEASAKKNDKKPPKEGPKKLLFLGLTNLGYRGGGFRAPGPPPLDPKT